MGMNKLADLVRKLRGEAFKLELAHERQWETEEEEQARIDRNNRRREEYNAETERMISEAMEVPHTDSK